MLRHVDLAWTDVSDERIADAGSSHTDFSTLKMEAIRSSETSVHARYTRLQIPEDGILLDLFLWEDSTSWATAPVDVLMV
jgi:hypothetical protein